MNSFLQIILLVGFIMILLRMKRFRWFIELPFVKWFLIPLILLVFWSYASIQEVYKLEQSYTTLSDDYSHSGLIYFKEGELLQGDKVKGEFTASDKNLGTIAVRFNTFYRDNDDYLIFRIKELNSPNWYYENQYKVDQFQPDKLFPFGFPVIADSKGKKYLFEIESTKGVVENSVGVSKFDPVYTAKYKYEKSEVLSTTETIITFLFSKILNVLQKLSFLIASFIFLIPFLFYILYQKSKDSILKKSKKPNIVFKVIEKFLFSKPLKLITKKMRPKNDYEDFANSLLKQTEKNLHWLITLDVYGLILLFVLSIAILGSILFTLQTTVTTFALTLLWIILIYLYKIPYRASFIMGFLFLLIAPLLDFVELDLIAEKVLGWAIIFFSICVFQLIGSLNEKKSKLKR